MDNQQPKVSDIDTGWVAGFFDGEGSVMLAIRATAGKNQAPKIYPLISISNADAGSLQRMTDTLDGAGQAYHVVWYQPPGFMKSGAFYKECWKLTISGHKRVKRFLFWLTPHLTEKRERAEKTLDFIAERERHTDSRTPITERELALALEVRELNKRRGRALPYTTAMKLNAERPGASHEQ